MENQIFQQSHDPGIARFHHFEGNKHGSLMQVVSK